MAFAAGAISLVLQAAQEIKLSSTAATGGTSPYTYQWYRSVTSGFTPGSGNLLSGKTALTLDDTGLVPGTTYYYVIRATDTGNSNVTADSAQFTQATLGNALSPNQFAQAPVVGMLDQKFNYDTLSVIIDSTQATPLLPGAAVKIVDSVDGVPKVIGITADSDEVLGFIQFNFKDQQWSAGMAAEISAAGNVQYLYATGAVARGVLVSPHIEIGQGAVRAASGHTGDKIVGWAYDKATAAGQLIRVFVKTPSFTVV